MSLIRIEIDKRVADGASEAVIGKVLRAGRDAVEAATSSLHRDIRDLTRAAVKGDVANAWRSQVFPIDGSLSYSPTGTIFPNGTQGSRTRGMLSYWSTPGINRARDGQWLAIPTAAAGVRGRGRKLSPREWEKRTGIPLEISYRKGSKYPVLIASGVAANNGSGALRRATTRRATLDRAAGRSRDRQTAAIFVLIPFQRHADKVGLESAIRRADAQLKADFQTRLALID